MAEKTEASSATSITVPLTVPIQVHGEEVSSLTLNDPDLGALEGVHVDLGQQGARLYLGQLPAIIAAMANIPPSSAKKIKMRDLVAIGPEVMDFLGLSQVIGES